MKYIDKEEYVNLLTSLNLSLGQLGKILGVSKQYLSQLKTGTRDVPDHIFYKMQDIKLGKFTGGDTWRTDDTAKVNWHICMQSHITTVKLPCVDDFDKVPEIIVCPICDYASFSMHFPQERPIPYSIPAPEFRYVDNGDFVLELEEIDE